MSDGIRILLVDDHPVVRLGLSMAIEAAGFSVCGEAADVATARDSVARLGPDAIVLDLTLGGRDGIELLGEIRALQPAVKVLVFSALPELTYAPRVFKAGGHGYLMKDDGAERVPEALTVILRGERYASAAVQSALFQAAASGGLSHGDALSTLSDRELQVLRLTAAGRSLGEMAAELMLSVKTIGTHRERLKTKLGVSSVRELERLAQELQRLGRT
jgi:two-component system invasion response regulator UvrY